MEGLRQLITKPAPVSCNSHISLHNSSSGCPEKTRSARSHVHARALGTALKPQTRVGYENTYRMEPGGRDRFSATRVQQVIGDVFEHYLRDQDYDPKVFPKLIKSLAEAIKDGVKTQHLNRFKIITTVTVVQKKDQGTQISSQAIWDPLFDNYASMSYEGTTYAVVGAVYAIYQE